MSLKPGKIRLIFFLYWFLLVYIIAALVWWFIALSRQNEQMTNFKLQELNKENSLYETQYKKIQQEKKRKEAQYAGEGSIFFLLIAAGAIFVYRAVNRELKISRQQQQLMMALTHELKTPIAIAKLNLETLQLRKLDETQQQRLIYNTLQETNRLNSLCNNMLLSSQFEAGGYRVSMEETNLSEIVQTCVDDFRIRYPQRQIASEIEKDIFILADAFLLQISLNNLLDNAIKYSPKEAPVTVHVKHNSSAMEIEVMDCGPGIDEEEKQKIFEKFYRLGNEATKLSRGTGLGLFLAKKIITTHSGKITVSNRTGGGSVFTIHLNEVV